MVGVIMIVGLLITPAALAYMLTDRLPRMMVLAAFFGVLSVVAGLYFSEWVNASGGGAIMFMGFILFIIGLIFAPKYGLLAAAIRRRRIVPQSDLEDILKAAYEGKTSLTDVRVLRARARRGLKRLVADGLLEREAAKSGRLKLTAKGEQEAAHIVRSHQLWEAHFIDEGMDPDSAHAAAEQLEHLHEREILDRFDDELDHPRVDSHGEQIPGETEAGDMHPVVRLSLLRPGSTFTLEGAAAAAVGVEAGEPLELAAIEEGDDLSWRVKRPNGKTLHVPHDRADTIDVRL